MSQDTCIQLRTPFSAQQVRAVLVNDPALADLQLVDHPEDSGVAGQAIYVSIAPWAGDDDRMIDDGFDTAAVFCMTMARRGEAGWEAGQRVFAAILRAVPGDMCLAEPAAAGPGLLRLGEVIYVDPRSFNPEHLAAFGYTPPRLVIGIPDRCW